MFTQTTLPWLRFLQFGVRQRASMARMETGLRGRSLTLEGASLDQLPQEGPVSRAIDELLEQSPAALEIATQHGNSGETFTWKEGVLSSRPWKLQEPVPTRLTITCTHSLKKTLLEFTQLASGRDILQTLFDPSRQAVDLEEFQRRCAYCSLPLEINGRPLPQPPQPIPRDAEVRSLGEAMIAVGSGKETSLLNFTQDGILVGQRQLWGLPTGKAAWGVWPLTVSQVDPDRLQVSADLLNPILPQLCELLDCKIYLAEV